MYNILVCDDEKDIVSALEIYLTSEGYRVFKAYNGREALGVIQKEDIHLVLLDVMMPEMDGITAMVEIRKITNIPVILLTAKSEDNDKVLGLNIGADDYITKPFNPIEVMARVKSQLRRFLQLGGGSRKVLVAAGHHANECITSDALWQWLFAYCEALLDGGALDGVPARELYHDTMVYLVPLANPDGADLAAGATARNTAPRRPLPRSTRRSRSPPAGRRTCAAST